MLDRWRGAFGLRLGLWYAALFVAGRAVDVAEGIELAAESIDSGAAAERVAASAAFVDA